MEISILLHNFFRMATKQNTEYDGVSQTKSKHNCDYAPHPSGS